MPWLREKCFLYSSLLFVILFAIIVNYAFLWIWSVPGLLKEPLPEYDYVIVGAGTSGCTIASRLSEKCDCKILLVEAGGTAPFASSIPLVAPALQLTAADWAYKTVPQKHSHYGMNDQRSFWPRGKTLGGSSAINYLLHMWGTRSDFNSYASLTLDESWTFTNVRKFFMRSESYYNENKKKSSGVRGKNGPLPIEEVNTVPLTLAKAFVEGAMNLGLAVGDLNGDLENGVMLAQSNVRNGKRVSTFDAYLSPILQLSDISILINTVVTKILFNGKKAVGVQMDNFYMNKTYTVHFTREIIICAGVIGSPHLLMLSGIGPEDQLEKLNISVVENLPGVGQNLRDHLNLAMYFHLDSPVSLTTDKARSVSEVWKYFAKGEGYLSHSGVEVVARIPRSSRNTTEPDIYYMLLNVGSIDENIFKKIANFKHKEFTESFPETHNKSKEGFVLLVGCSHPQSVGEVTLTSSNPFVEPEIDPNYLDDEDDVKCFLEAMRMGARLGTTKPLQALGSRLHLPAFKECAEYKQSLDNDKYMECWLRTVAMTGYHPLGTCSVGNDNDPFAVIDATFRVRNVDRVRVVDGSVLPHPTSGTPHATIAALGEMAAELILEDQFWIPT